MRKLYFLRHGEPAFPGGIRLCLGRLDLPLSVLGRLQAAKAAHHLCKVPVAAAFSSPLKRARQTAVILHRPIHVLEGLQEIDTGEWDGRSFEEIKRIWPRLYEQRGRNPFLALPQAEPQGLSLMRFLHAVGTAAQCHSGDLLFVTHSGILCAFFSALKKLPSLGALPSLTREEADRILATSPAMARREKPSYGSISTVVESGGNLGLQECGYIPHPALDSDFCHRLLDAAQVPMHIRRHTAAVAAEAGRLLSALEHADVRLPRESILSAALLHDIARTEKAHAKRGAEYLDKLGYPEVAALIRSHHDLPPGKALDEAAIVFLADKLVQEDQPTSLNARFKKSSGKCISPEQKKKHQERFHAALQLAMEANEICGHAAVRI